MTDNKKCTLSILIYSNKNDLLLSRCLKSIHKQSLSPKQIIVSQSDAPIAIKLKQPPTGFHNRGVHLDLVGTEILLYLDEDTELPNEFYLENLVNLFQKYPYMGVLGGAYCSSNISNKTSRWEKAYNHLCESWLLLQIKGKNTCLLDNRKLDKTFQKLKFIEVHQLLGGCFALHLARMNCSKMELKNYWPNFWGGEEFVFFQNLRQKQINFYNFRSLNVLHYPNVSLINCLKRAWRQGKTKSGLYEKKIPVIQHLPPIYFWDFYFLHFIILWISKIFATPNQIPTK